MTQKVCMRLLDSIGLVRDTIEYFSSVPTIKSEIEGVAKKLGKSEEEVRRDIFDESVKILEKYEKCNLLNPMTLTITSFILYLRKNHLPVRYNIILESGDKLYPQYKGYSSLFINEYRLISELERKLWKKQP